MVVVNQFPKAPHFIRAQEIWSTVQMDDAFVDNVFCLHVLPDKIVSNQGMVFVSNFWKAVCQRLRIEVSPSTAFHPQTDCQVERIKAILEDYLWNFVSDKQEDWSKWLSLAEFAFHNLASLSTGLYLSLPIYVFTLILIVRWVLLEFPGLMNLLKLCGKFNNRGTQT